MKIKHYVLVAISVILGGFLLLGINSNHFYTTNANNNVTFAKVWIESEFIPKKYTCDGENINPKITFDKKGIYAVIMHDPDAPAGDWFHWGIIVWNTSEIPEGIPKVFGGENFMQTYNDFYYYHFIGGNIKGIGYDGPCPPPGKPHRYVFEIHELDSLPNKEIKDKNELIEFVKKHSIKKAEFVYYYGR